MKKYDPVRNTLKDYRIEVDTDLLWQKTAHAIPRKRKRRMILLILAGMGCLFVTSGILLLQDTPAKQTTQGSVETAPMTGTPTPSHSESNDHSAPMTSVGQPSEIPHSSSPLTPSTYHTSTGQISDRDVARSSVSDHLAIPRDEPYKMMSLKSPPMADTSSADPKPMFSITSIKNDPESTSSLTEVQAMDEVSQPVDEIKIKEAPSANRLVMTTSSLDQLLPDGVDFSERALPSLDPSPEIKPLRKGPSFYLMGLQAIGASDMRIQSGSPEALPNAALWQQTMKSLEYTSTTGYGVLRWRNGLEAGAGIKYRRQITRIQYDWIQSNRTTGDGTATVIIDEQGASQYINGQIDVTEETTYRSTRYTRFQALDLTFFLSKILLRRPHWEIAPFAEAGWNMSFLSSGTSFDPANQLVRFTKKDAPFRSVAPWTWGAGLDLRYKSYTGLSLSARLGIDQMRYQHTDPALPLRIRHISPYLALGVTLALNE